jgi:ATP-binding cassette, subfamily C (CFTR/MRP), member 1
MLSLRVETGNSSAAVSLMSTDIDRVMVTLQWCLGIIPNIIQVSLAMWILYMQMGAVMIAPVVVALSKLIALSHA